MNEAAIVILVLVGAMVLLPILLRHTKRIGRNDPYLQWFHSGGKLLTDYDEEQKMIDQYSK